MSRASLIITILSIACARAYGQFELIPRQPSGAIFEVEESSPPVEELSPERGDVEWSQRDWNAARQEVEEGPKESTLASGSTSQILLTTAAPSLPPAEVEAPQYGASLSVTGRKVIGFNVSEKRFTNQQTTVNRPQDTHLFDIQQQLQIRMQGKVGPKITVNVDYDDTKENKQDISVVYQGDPEEVVQYASFGDIDLSLPATEFVSYNKQLFGIRANLKYKSLSAILIGSRTKGTTRTKQFFGNTQFEAKDIQDTAYLRRQYYDLTFGNPARLPIPVGSEQIFLDEQNPNVATLVNTSSITADDLGNSAVTYTGNFRRLAPGQDYTVDYAKGVLTLRVAAQPQHVLIADFTNANGTRLASNSSPASIDAAGTGRPKLIKTTSDLPIVLPGATDPAPGQVGWQQELKTHYSVGRNQLVRDDGRGNFILRVVDQNHNEVGSGLNPAQKYPDGIEVDFENGTFRLLRPFGDPSNPATPDTQIYAPTPLSRRLIHVEYHFRFKTFTLDPSLVLNSETVIVDGVKLTRNVDYFIDYDVGFLSFFNPERIGPNSEIDVTYEVAPFGGVGTESLLGARVGYDVNSHWALGSTLLYQAGARPPTTPNINDLPRSLLVYEGDSQLKNLRLLPFLTGSFSLEAAQSRANPNLAGFALVDNMEGVKQSDGAALDKNLWSIAANPAGSPPADPRAVNLANANVRTLDINPNAQANAGDVQLVLQVGYDFASYGSSEVSVVFPFSNSGLDFSQKTFLEVVMFAPNSPSLPGPQLNFHLGQINEDADGTGGTTLFCSNGTTLVNAPKTEDINCDGVLQPSEDIGWLYAPPGLASGRVGGNNGRIDTEDLNHNGRLDAEDFSGCSVGYAASAGCPTALFDTTQASSITAPNFTGWHTFQIPLNISSATAQNWAAIHQIRLSMKQFPGGATSGYIQIARLAVVGNTWQQPQVQGAGGMSVGAVNNADNPSYIPIFSAGGDAQSVFTDLYGSVQQQEQLANTSKITEQSLELRFDGLTPGSTSFTQRHFASPIDISQHKQLRFLLYGNAPPASPSLTGSTFFLRIGDDVNNWEVHVPAGFPGWQLITLNLASSLGNGVADTITNGSPYAVAVSSNGSPNLQSIGQLSAGLYNTSGGNVSGAMWLDEIHVSQSQTRVGNAQKAQADFDVPGWMSFGGKHRYLDRNFQTPVSVVTNQDNQQDSGYLNFKRIGVFPMSFNVNRTITDTPNVAGTGNLSNLVNQLQQGRVAHWNGTGSGAFSYGAWPKLSLNYTRDLTDYDLLERKDDRNTYASALGYAVPGDVRVLPKTVDLGYSLTRYMVDFQRPEVLALPGNFNTDEFTNNYTAKLSFTPWAQTTFAPSYSLTEVNEKRIDYTSGSPVFSRYPKAMTQVAGANLNLKLAKWLSPTMNYQVTTIENNNLSSTSFLVNGTSATFDVGDLKTVNRNANGGVTLPLNFAEILPKVKPLRSLNVQTSYQLQDGDVWQNVERGLDTRSSLWIRSPLRPNSPVAQETNLTLRDTITSTQRWSPLEAYGLAGRWAPFKTLSLTNNYVLSLQKSVVTGTPSRTRTTTLPDVVASMSQLEALIGTQRWMSNTVLNLKSSFHKTENFDVSLAHDQAFGADLRFIFKSKFDTSMSGNYRTSDSEDLRSLVVTQTTEHEDGSIQTTFDVKAWRFTPKVDFSRDVAKQGDGLLTQDTKVITPSVLARADLTLPRGLKLPLGKLIIFTNRIIWTNTLSFAIRRSDVAQTDNNNLLNFTTSADYELAKNLRMTINGSAQSLHHLFLPEENFFAYQLGTTLTFQF